MSNPFSVFDNNDDEVTKTIEVKQVAIQGNILACPICRGCGNLHHRRVIIYNRSEDEKTVTVAQSNVPQGTIERAYRSSEVDNPSPRRDGIAIDFECEQCCAEERGLQLVIYQHKGDTFIEWRARNLHGV